MVPLPQPVPALLLRSRVCWAVLHRTRLLWWRLVVELVLARRWLLLLVAVALPECRLV